MAKLHPVQFVKKLFGTKEVPNDFGSSTPAMEAASDDNEELQDNASQGIDGSHFNKLTLLRDSLKLDDDIADKINEIFTPLNMLVFIYENILFKFEILRTLGVLNDSTYRNINLIQNKCQLMLAPGAQGSQPRTMEDLEHENESLKKQLESLYSKYVKSDIVSGEELRLEEDLRKMKSRYENIAKRYDFSRKKIESLAKDISRLEKINTKYELLKQKFSRYKKNDAITQETLLINKDLEIKNKALKAKLDYQERLLNAVVWSGSQNNEVVQSVANLNSKKEELTQQMLDKDKNIAALVNSDPPAGSLPSEVNILIGENKNLYNELSSEDKIESLSEHNENNASVLYNLEALQDENHYIENIIDAQNNVINNVQSYVEGQSDTKLISALQDENKSLRQALEAKKNKIKTLVNNPEYDRLLAKNSELNRTVIRLHHEIDNLSHTITVLNVRCKDAEAKLDGARQIARTNIFLKRESDKLRFVVEKYNTLQSLYNEKNKALVGATLRLNSALETCKKLQIQNSIFEAKVDSLHAQYSGLMDEYNKLFHNS